MFPRVFRGLLALAVASALAPSARADGPPAAPPLVPPRLSVADARVAALDAAGDDIHTRFRRARDGGQTERAQCLDELLTRAHVAARYGRALREALRSALDDQNEAAATRELTRLVHLGERGSSLVTEADHCGGGPSPIAGEGSLRVIAPRLPDADEYPKR